MVTIYQGSRTYMETNLTVEKMTSLKIPFLVVEHVEKPLVEVKEEERTLAFDPKKGFSLKY